MTNFLSPLEFDFTVKRLPNVSFMVQAVNLPGMSIGIYEQPTPFKLAPRAGDHITYDELTITMKVDDEMNAWTEVYEWMKGLTSPDGFDQYKDLKDGEGLYSDGTIQIMSNIKNPKIEFTFTEMFPINMGPIQFDTRTPDLEFITVDVTFKFQSMNKK